MIIEIFGPAAAGKTTLAKAISVRLRDQGYDVRLASSYRPAEISTARGARAAGPVIDALQRLQRAVVETTLLLSKNAVNRDDIQLTGALLRLMRPGRFISSLRIYQYIIRLAYRWRGASTSENVTVFDQGFVQAVYSLAVLGGGAGRLRIDDAIRLIPMPDLIVRLHVPSEILAARLAKRHRRHGRLERLLETSPAENLASMPLFNCIDHSLQRRSAPVVDLKSQGDWPLDLVFQKVEDAVRARCPTALQSVRA